MQTHIVREIQDKVSSVVFSSFVTIASALGLFSNVSTTQAATNLVPNASFEVASEDGSAPVGFTRDEWGNHNTLFKYPISGHSGSKAASVTVSNYVDGDAKWFFNEISVTPGHEYVFSDWFRMKNDSWIWAQYRMDDNSFQYVLIGRAGGGNGWQQFSEKIIIPSKVVSMTILHVIASDGTLTVDDYSLVDNGVAKKFNQGMVTFSFDDGTKDIYNNGIPILNKAGIKSTQAVITDTLGSPGYMSKENIVTLAKDGHEIASHTLSHEQLATLSKTAARNQIEKSKRILRSYGIKVDTLVYPCGSYNPSVVSLVEKAGFVGARTTDGGFNSPSANAYKLRSQPINNDTSLSVVKAWIDSAREERSWLVLTLHRQEAGGDTYSNDPALLQGIVDYVKSTGIQPVTLSQGVALLQK